jgi:hypothetical protein
LLHPRTDFNQETQKEKAMNRYKATTPRAAAGAAALAATALVIGLSVIAPAKMSPSSAELGVQVVASTPIVLDRIEICAERNPELVSAHAKDAPEISAHQL